MKDGLEKANQKLTTIWVTALLMLGVGARLWVWAQPLDKLIAWTLTDDAFYYFKIATNIAQGKGSTFDGIHLTNGYHPLWMVINVMVFQLLANRWMAVHGVLLVGLLFELAAGLMLAYLAWRLRQRRSYVMMVLFLWLWNYRVIASGLNGMETALSMFTIHVLLFTALTALEKPSSRALTWFGLSAGTAILARTDNALLVLLLAVAISITHRRLKLLLLPGAISAIITLPWFLWNYIHFTSLIQTSGTAITHLIIKQLEARYGSPLPFPVAIKYWANLWLNTTIRLYILSALPFGRPWFMVSAVWLVVGLAWLMRDRQPLFASVVRLPLNRLIFWGVLGLWPIVFITVHVVGRWYFRPYYYASLTPSVLLFLGLLIDHLLHKDKRTRLWAFLFVPFTIFGAVLFARSDLYRHQLTMMTAAQ